LINPVVILRGDATVHDDGAANLVRRAALNRGWVSLQTLERPAWGLGRSDTAINQPNSTLFTVAPI